MGPDKNFLVVGIGASAGGLTALTDFFRDIPADCNIAFVVVTHLWRHMESTLAEILQRKCSMPVHRVDQNIPMAPGNIYVLREGYYIISMHGELVLQTRPQLDVVNRAVDIFFESLGKDLGRRAAGIILSGTGTDGLQGVKVIEDHGGFVMVQDPDTAHFDGMPMTIIKFDHPDVIDSPANLASFIVSYAQQVDGTTRQTA